MTINQLSLDDLDRRILDQLQTDSSITNEALALKVHASPPTCLRRVRRLRQEGIIEKQLAILNPAKVGHTITAICEITLDIQTAEFIRAFEARISKEPAITQCYQVSPGPDFIIIAQLTNMPAYRDMAHQLFTSNSNVRNVRTFFSINRSKFSTRVPIPASSTAG